mmetsp:Transcript_70248/g.217861  ORF Transcript_70248/g.217861 Transcript_70248/m.217861 type:complete len:210 (+) Transcript_70248:159-788(+)
MFAARTLAPIGGGSSAAWAARRCPQACSRAWPGCSRRNRTLWPARCRRTAATRCPCSWTAWRRTAPSPSPCDWSSALWPASPPPGQRSARSPCTACAAAGCCRTSWSTTCSSASAWTSTTAMAAPGRRLSASAASARWPTSPASLLATSGRGWGARRLPVSTSPRRAAAPACRRSIASSGTAAAVVGWHHGLTRMSTSTCRQAGGSTGL